MSYQQKLQQSKDKAAEHLLGTKIRDLMTNLRNGKAKNAARRWIWELIQNAKDVAFETNPVKIEVSLESEDNARSFKFRHNGKPFSIDDITFLIEQVSTKDQEITETEKTKKKKKTGKFGTGFLSTHLLSEVVKVNGVLKDEGLPYKAFEAWLDRTPETIPAIVASVKNSLDAVYNKLESGEDLHHYDSSAFNTSFTYVLQGNKEEMVKVGIEDLIQNIPFTLAFATDVAEVRVAQDLTVYKVIERRFLDDSNIQLVTIDAEALFETTTRLIAIAQGELAAIAAELETAENGSYCCKRRAGSCPTLFCEFPLIGSEVFPFPVIINSPQFNPVEPRNGVWLTAEDTSDVKQNEAILEEAIELYGTLLQYASDNDWGRLFELARIHPAVETEWLSADWYNTAVLEPVRDILSTVPIVDTIEGKTLLFEQDKAVWFPDHPDPEIRMKIWRLAEQWIPRIIPLQQEVHAWNEVVWDSCKRLTLAVIANSIQNAEKVSTFQKNFNNSEKKTLKWLNEFYAIVKDDPNFEGEIQKGTYKIIPNQEGTFLKPGDLLLDKKAEIEVPFKTVSGILGFNLREKLLEQDAYPGNVTFVPHGLQQVLNDLNIRLTDTKIAHENRQAAAAFLANLTNKENSTNPIRITIQQLTTLLYEDGKYIVQVVKANNPDCWKEADPVHVRAMVRLVAQFNNLENFKTGTKLPSDDEAIQWLNRLVSLLSQMDLASQLNLEKSPILPSQSGEFRKLDDLLVDNTSHPELKEIAFLLGHDFFTELLDVDIELYVPENKQVSDQQVATKISELARLEFSKVGRSDDIKDAFRRLVQFFSKDPEKSQKLFGELYLSKHKLYDDKEIVDNFQKVAAMNTLMENHGIETMEDLEKVIKRGTAAIQTAETESTQLDDKPKKEVTKELLASWGITSEAQYMIMVGNDVDNAIFRHYSRPDPALYAYSHDIIARARKNVLAHLETLPAYDCTNAEGHADTVIGGIKKEGRHIYVVVRPSDGQEVIFYYDAEYMALDEDNTELWVENGFDTPIFLTLGKILKGTGINRIPLAGITADL